MIAPVPTPEELARLELEVLPRLMRLVAAAAGESGPGTHGFLSVTQFRVLKRLARGPWLGSDLAQALRLTPPTVSSAIDSLVRRGLVERGETPEDRRAVPLQLTAEGRACLDAVQEKVISVLTPLLQQLEPEERAALNHGLRALARAMASRPNLSSSACRREGYPSPLDML